MKHLKEHCEPVDSPDGILRMDFDARQKVRSRVAASNGEVVGVHIERGTSLRDGDHLRSSDGAVFVVRAKAERLSVIVCQDPVNLARAAYHLGNRHVRLQIGDRTVRYQRDHVLDEMTQKLGFSVEHRELPFEPERGAYHRHDQTEASGHSHTLGSTKEHSHAGSEGHSHSNGHSH